MIKPDTKRRRIEAQGFMCLTNDEVEDLNVWLRFTPAITLGWFAIGVALASANVLLVLLGMTLLGAILTGHPFDVLYNHGLRYLVRGAEIPPFSRQRRFAYLLSSAYTAATAGLFMAGLTTAGYILGGVAIGNGAVYVATGYCPPSYIYNAVFDRVEALADDDDGNKIESVSPLWPKP